MFLVKLINEKIEFCMSSDFGSKINLIASLNHLLDPINNVLMLRYKQYKITYLLGAQLIHIQFTIYKNPFPTLILPPNYFTLIFCIINR